MSQYYTTMTFDVQNNLVLSGLLFSSTRSIFFHIGIWVYFWNIGYVITVTTIWMMWHRRVILVTNSVTEKCLLSLSTLCKR